MGREPKEDIEMADNYVQPGEVLTLVAPSGGVVSGRGYVIGGAGGRLFAIALTSADENKHFEGKVTGVFEMPKATHDTTKAFAAGETVYYDTAEHRWDKAANDFIEDAGQVIEAAASTAGTCKVRLLNQPVKIVSGL